MGGYNSQITCTTLSEYCGAYSHVKLAKITDYKVNVPISPPSCLNMIHQQAIITPQKRKENIKIGIINMIKSYELESIQANEYGVSCRGQTQRIGIHIVEEIIQV